ncbi:MAG: hypothetical protein ACK5YR_03310 [Pirellula sp.]
MKKYISWPMLFAIIAIVIILRSAYVEISYGLFKDRMVCILNQVDDERYSKSDLRGRMTFVENYYPNDVMIKEDLLQILERTRKLVMRCLQAEMDESTSTEKASTE